MGTDKNIKLHIVTDIKSNELVNEVINQICGKQVGRSVEMASTEDYKDSLIKMASSAISASKTWGTRARQFTEERIGSAEKTEYGAQFENLASRAERTKIITDRLLKNFESVLQPNPGIRMEEFVYEQLDKKTPLRPTNAFSLGQVMQDGSQEIGPGTSYGSTLLKVGSTMKKIGNSEKDFVQQSLSHVIQPLRSFLDNEMKTK